MYIIVTYYILNCVISAAFMYSIFNNDNNSYTMKII
jgi:hypothetical protein